jgi:hypothetical protein
VAGALLGGVLPPAAMPMATAARAKLAPAKQAAEAWMLLGSGAGGSGTTVAASTSWRSPALAAAAAE